MTPWGLSVNCPACRGIQKRDGNVMLGAHVERITMQNGRATGVQLRGGGTVTARKAVVSNAFGADTIKLLDPDQVAAAWARSLETTESLPSFMHLHLGFDATGTYKHLMLALASLCCT